MSRLNLNYSIQISKSIDILEWQWNNIFIENSFIIENYHKGQQVTLCPTKRSKERKTFSSSWNYIHQLDWWFIHLWPGLCHMRSDMGFKRNMNQSVRFVQCQSIYTQKSRFFIPLIQATSIRRQVLTPKRRLHTILVSDESNSEHNALKEK